MKRQKNKYNHFPLNIALYPAGSAAFQMQEDEALWRQAEHEPNQICLRFYDWIADAVTYGYNQQQIDLEQAQDRLRFSGKWIKRPTGGGVILHHPGDISWSVMMPLIGEGFRFSMRQIFGELSQVYQATLVSVGVEAKLVEPRHKEQRIEPLCIDVPSRYELVDKSGQKLLGSAQRKGQRWMLQQCHLFINMDQLTFRSALSEKLREWSWNFS